MTSNKISGKPGKSSGYGQKHREAKERKRQATRNSKTLDLHDDQYSSYSQKIKNTNKNSKISSVKNISYDNVSDEEDMKEIPVHKESSLMVTLNQTKVLLWRNFQIFSRKTKIIAFMILTPLMICLMLQYMCDIMQSLQEEGVGTRDIESIEKIAKCTNPLYHQKGDPQCATIGYSIIGDKRKDRQGQYDYIHDLMKLVAEKNDLEYGVDVKPLTVGKSGDLKDYLINNKNTTSYAVLFCAESWHEEVEVQTINKEIYNESLSKEERDQLSSFKFDFHMPCKFDHHPEKTAIFYSLMYNMSLQENAFFKAFYYPFPTDNNLMSLKLSLDNSVLEMKAKENGFTEIPEIEMSYQAYPFVKDRLYQGDPILAAGSFYMILVPLTVFMVIYGEMMHEKAYSLRMGLQQIGCSNTAYWLSWTLTGIIFSIIMSILTTIMGKLFAFTFFVNTQFYLIALLLFSVCFAELCIAFFLVTLMKDQSFAYTVCYTFILVTIICTMALMQVTIIYKLFYNLDLPAWTIYFRYFFEMLPSFIFTKIFGDISRVTCVHVSYEKSVFLPGREYTIDDLFAPIAGSFMTMERYEAPSSYESMVKMYKVSFIYYILALYFDAILSHNRGAALPLYFPLMPSYWFPSCKKNQNLNKAKSRKRSTFKFADESTSSKSLNLAKEEKKMVIFQENEGIPNTGIRIIDISKTYDTKVQALKNVYLEVQRGELLGIMGHNGAGKTTLINVLGGMISLTDGNARVYDLTLVENLQLIRRKMGVVSQFDVLWDELTGLDHMNLFSQIKRLQLGNNAQHYFNQRLKEVGLLDSANLQVGKYSGGMRRRMSVALSSLGSPEVILMDEPTTGMDPCSRRSVWDLINRLKKRCAVILTTHSMEEAEILSDKLAVLDHGEVRCVGSPLQLKNLLGKGYRVNLVCNKKHINQVKSLFRALVPSSEFYESSGDSGSLVYNVPLDKVKELGFVFKLIENKKKSSPDDEEEQTVSVRERKALIYLRKLVKDIGVSQTTLEEVFMAATSSTEISNS